MILKHLILITTLLILASCDANEKKAGSKEIATKKTIHKYPDAKAELEYKIEADLGEGALWDYTTNTLYWIDIENNALYLYQPTTQENKTIALPSRIGTVVPINSNTVLTALEDGIYKTNIESGNSKLFLDMEKELEGKRLNDGKCDPAGRFWVGSMHLEQKEGEAKLYTVDALGQLKTKIDSVTISNGIVWTADKTKMYYIDTPTSEIKSYDYDNATGHISNARVVIKVPEALGFPDGMTIDAEDMLWVGMWNGNAVLRFNPNTGKVIQTIDVPAHNVTSCAFGGEHLDILYITSARVDMSEEELEKYPLSGSIFSVRPGAKGTICSHYKKQLQ